MSDEISVTVIRYPDRPNLVLAYTDPVSGKRKTKTAGTDDEGEAWKAGARWEEELRAGPHCQPSRVTWAEFRKRYTEERLATLSYQYQHSVKCSLGCVERVLNPDRLCKMTTAAVSRFATELRKRKTKDSTLASHLRIVKAALRWAKRMGMLAVVPEFTMPHSGDAKGRPITTEEFERMLAKIPSIRPVDTAVWEHLLTGLWLSGLRLTEGLILSWEPDAPFSVDLSGKYPAFQIERKAQKSRRHERLPMTPDFAEWLLATFPEHERHGRVFKLVGLQRGGPIKKAGSIIRLFGRKAGVVVARDPDSGKVKHATAHDLRRSFGTRWAPRVKTTVLQRLMRHRDIATTMKYYVALESDDLAADLWADFRKLGNKSGNIEGENGVFFGENGSTAYDS